MVQMWKEIKITKRLSGSCRIYTCCIYLSVLPEEDNVYLSLLIPEQRFYFIFKSTFKCGIREDRVPTLSWKCPKTNYIFNSFGIIKKNIQNSNSTH